jgi:hypothetical protein
MALNDESEGTMTTNLEALKATLAKATPGDWERDSEKGENAYGSGPDCGENYKVALIGAAGPDGKWMTLFDSHNSDAASVEEEYDEDGYGYAWDAVAEANAAAIVAAHNALPGLIAEHEQALATIAALRGEVERLRAMIDGPLADIAAERARQMCVEGWTPEHDDDHSLGEAVEPCQYCGPGVRTGLPGNACENCMNTGVQITDSATLEIRKLWLDSLPCSDFGDYTEWGDYDEAQQRSLSRFFRSVAARNQQMRALLMEAADGENLEGDDLRTRRDRVVAADRLAEVAQHLRAGMKETGE